VAFQEQEGELTAPNFLVRFAVPMLNYPFALPGRRLELSAGIVVRFLFRETTENLRLTTLNFSSRNPILPGGEAVASSNLNQEWL
jgi:hypothetical protein